MIEYQSTRGEAEILPFSGVIMEGLASDGGLYVPVQYPQLSSDKLRNLGGSSYQEVFAQIVAQFVDPMDMPTITHRDVAQTVYRSPNFGVSDDAIVTPVNQVGEGIYVQELYHGPTLAFKDMALQALGRYFGKVLDRDGGYLNMLGATSGDTGSSAEAAVLGVPGVALAMMSPQCGMSDFQQAQMGELSGDNILNLSVDGTFDDCQDLVKAIKSDPEFNALGAVNSINWGRVAFQVPYYVSGYLQTVGDKIGEPIDVVVPSGNFGNVLAGHIARKMGVPIRRLIIATNENNVLNTLVQTGEYRKKPSQITSSPSMDISTASNYERLVLDIMDGDQERTRRYMDMFRATDVANFSDFGLPQDTMGRLGFDSGVSNHPGRLEAMRWVMAESGMFIDPHTADGINVALRFRDDAEGVPILCMATAHPSKFEATVYEALGKIPERPERLVGIEERVADKPEAFVEAPADIDVVKAILRLHDFANRPN